MGKVRPNGLTALCILSWVWMAFSLLSVVTELNTGRLTEADIREQKIVILESQTPETIEMMPWVVEESIEMLCISRDNFSTMMIINFVALIIGLIGVFLMFQLRKIGFYMYIGYSIISIAYWLYYFSGMTFGWIIISTTAIFSALFIILYGTQLKKMT
ncbi:MAG: hypothetical protein P8I55_02165 [Crocinitomix sp.]|nr:hypothetical protein [Crocinitomix sp.]